MTRSFKIWILRQTLLPWTNKERWEKRDKF